MNEAGQHAQRYDRKANPDDCRNNEGDATVKRVGDGLAYPNVRTELQDPWYR